MSEQQHTAAATGGDQGGGVAATMFQQGVASTPVEPAAGDPSAAFREAVLAEDGSFNGRWTDHLPEDLKNQEATLGRFPNLVELARSYVHARSKLGEKLQPPGESATPEQVKAWRELLGVPEDPSGYGVKKPEKLPDGVEWSDALAGEFTQLAHKHNVPPAAVKEILSWYTEQSGQMASAAREAQEQWLTRMLLAQEQELRGEWGENMDERFGLALRAAKTFGLEGMPVDWTPKDVVKALEMAGRSMSEDKLIKADGPGAGRTGRAAAMEIMDPQSMTREARQYRGEFGPQEQAEAQALCMKYLAQGNARPATPA